MMVILSLTLGFVACCLLLCLVEVCHLRATRRAGKVSSICPQSLQSPQQPKTEQPHQLAKSSATQDATRSDTRPGTSQRRPPALCAAVEAADAADQAERHRSPRALPPILDRHQCSPDTSIRQIMTRLDDHPTPPVIDTTGGEDLHLPSHGRTMPPAKKQRRPLLRVTWNAPMHRSPPPPPLVSIACCTGASCGPSLAPPHRPTPTDTPSTTTRHCWPPSSAESSPPNPSPNPSRNPPPNPSSNPSSNPPPNPPPHDLDATHPGGRGLLLPSMHRLPSPRASGGQRAVTSTSINHGDGSDMQDTRRIERLLSVGTTPGSISPLSRGHAETDRIRVLT